MFNTRLRFLYIFLLGSYSYLNIKFTEGDSLLPQPINEISLCLILLLLVVLIWEGNRLLGKIFYQKKKEAIVKPLLNHFGSSLLWVFTLALGSQLLVGSIFGFGFDLVSLKQLIGFIFRVNLFLHCINAIVYYHQETRSAQLKAEQLEKQTAEAQYDALRRQVNPHFLFNSFNALSGLVRTDQTLAGQFIDQLSTVYRYLLKSEEQKLVLLSDELSFLEAYLFLLKIRFQDNLQVVFNLEEQSKDKYLVPCALQMLIENAIKHNEVSRKYPLTVNIYSESDSISVENKTRPKAKKEESSEIGLNNIGDRYVLLGESRPEVNHTNRVFQVKLPLVEIQEG